MYYYKNNHNFPKSNIVLPKFYQHLKNEFTMWIVELLLYLVGIKKTHQNLNIYRNKGMLESLGRIYSSDIFWATFLNWAGF